ncbi:pilus assembly protein [Massilia forsythiae]|uniref:Pilus assembly protein n=1 Tax=Massilia forsythiae TaxID=2728020 RepID=A0A7Z2ZS40_9BURK|nr:pilus assembly protein [Massilia forsythiae]QJD98676.1 pilus assembly protein [Massilia forsythiae]
MSAIVPYRHSHPYPRPRPCPRFFAYRCQRGVALVCTLLLVLAAMLLGVSVARTAFGSVASARQERDRALAHAMAQAALRDAEADVAAVGAPSSARAAHFAAAPGSGFVAGCGRGADDLGLCLPAAADAPPVWQAIDLAAADAPEPVPYGRFSGAALAAGSGILPARLPAYLIERLAPPAGAGTAAGVAAAGAPAAGPDSWYRITAIGFGTRATTQVVLQALYRKPAPAAASTDAAGHGAASAAGPGGAGPPAAADGDGSGGNAGGSGGDSGNAGAPQQQPIEPLPAGRIGWREIANWPALHARAQQ